MKTIQLTKGKETIVDDDDFEYLSQFNWYCDNKGYACRGFQRHKKIFMHRVVNVTPTGFETDHINRNKLDNRKCNLRSCTNTENQVNKNLNKNNTSGYKGVCFSKRKGLWQAYVSVNHSVKWLGYFDNPIEAAKAYDKQVLETYGMFVYLNFPDALDPMAKLQGSLF
jgi:hypothetical protein